MCLMCTGAFFAHKMRQVLLSCISYRVLLVISFKSEFIIELICVPFCYEPLAHVLIIKIYHHLQALERSKAQQRLEVFYLS